MRDAGMPRGAGDQPQSDQSIRTPALAQLCDVEGTLPHAITPVPRIDDIRTATFAASAARDTWDRAGMLATAIPATTPTAPTPRLNQP